MKKEIKRPPRSQALINSALQLQQQVYKRLDTAMNSKTKQTMLQVAEIIKGINDQIYRVCGKAECSAAFAPEITNERFTAMENAIMEISKQKIERSDRQAKQSTVKRTIIHEEITENEASESTTSVETETSSYKSQFLKSFGNRIFAARNQANKNPTEFQCIKDLLDLINSYVYHRFRNQYPELGMYHYSLEQIKQFTTIVILKYAVEYSHSPYNAKEFKQEMVKWIDRIGKDKEVTVKESLPKCLHKFDIERDVQITPTVLYIWYVLCNELKTAKRTKNETLDFDELFDDTYLDGIAQKIAPDVYYNCPYPASHDEISNYLD